MGPSLASRLVLAVLLGLVLAPTLLADVTGAVNELIPKLAAERTEDRYEPQMELQALCAHASRPGAEAERSQLASLLARKAADSDVPQPARSWIVRQIEYIGGAECVPTLAGLLNGEDPELRESARRALEKNPSPEATATLRDALSSSKDDARRTAGLIHSLGQRRDADAVALISPYLKHATLSAAAAKALGTIATSEAAKLLARATRDQPAALDALVLAADQMLADGRSGDAAKVYRRLDEEANPAPIRAAALAGQVRAKPKSAPKLISDALESGNARLQQAAILAATEAPSDKLSSTLAKTLPSLGASAKVQLLQILDPTAEQAVLQTARDSAEPVRIASLETLGRIGGPDSVPVLIVAATSENRSEQRAAKQSLAVLSGPGSDEAIRTRARKGDSAARNVAIEALSARNDTSVLSDLLYYAAEPEVSHAAFSALRQMGSDNQIDPLARLLCRTHSEDALAALKSCAGRVTHRDAAADVLLKHVRDTDPESAAALLEVLSVLGGKEPLALATRLLSNDNKTLREGALRALANWSDYDATQPLLQIATSHPSDPTHNVLAIRGLVRLIKNGADQPAQKRLDLALAAFRASSRDQEQKLVLSALGTIPLPAAAAAIKPLLQQEPLKAEAALAGVALAEALLQTDKDTARDLAQAVREANISRDINRRANRVLR